MRRWHSPKWYSSLPIRLKLFLWISPLLILTISATGVYSYSVAARLVIDRVQSQEAGSAKQAVDHLDYIAQDALDITDYLYLTPDIQTLLSSASNSDQNIANRNLIISINRQMVTRPYFQYLTIYSSHFPPLQFNSKGLSTALSFEAFSKRFHYRKMLQSPEITTWRIEIAGQGNTIFHGDNVNKLLLTYVLKNNLTLKPEGIVILGMDERKLRSSYSPQIAQSEIIVVNRDGTVLSDSSGEWLGRNIGNLPYFRRRFPDVRMIPSSVDTSKWIYSELQSSLTGWRVLVLQPRDTLLRQLNRIKWITLLMVCATLLICLFGSWFVAGHITRPMRLILSSMKKFQIGDFSQKVALSGLDEIGQLGQGYNTMVQRIKELIDDVYASQIRQRQSELKLLQSQINPHFLYNTLNAIAWSAHRNQDPEVADMIYALSGIFQISLSSGRDAIPLKEEIKLVEHILFLQKKRYPDKLSYEIEIDPELEAYPVPKLIIQPLVENAILHGIEPLREDKGFVQVAAGFDGDGQQIVIQVTDNGVGMDEEKLQELNRRVEYGGEAPPQGDFDSFALINIANRMRLFYGEPARMTIHSVIGSGTRIMLTMPSSRR